MNVLVILAHPDPASFNRAIADKVLSTLETDGHQTVFHDLYWEGFNPILPQEEIPKNILLEQTIKRYCRELATTDGIVIIHPNWWGQPPAILKGWVDRLFRPGVAYEFHEGDSGEGIPDGLLTDKTAIVFNTSNTPAEREQEEFGDPLENLWKNCIFKLCGVSRFYRKMFGVIVTSSPEQRKTWLKEVAETIRDHFPKDQS